MNFFHKMYYRNINWIGFNINKLNCHHHIYKTFDIDAFEESNIYNEYWWDDEYYEANEEENKNKFKHISPFFKFGMRGYEQDLLYKSDLFSEYFFEKKKYNSEKKLKFDISSIILTDEIQKLLHLENIFIDHLNNDNLNINLKQHKK